MPGHPVREMSDDFGRQIRGRHHQISGGIVRCWDQPGPHSCWLRTQGLTDPEDRKDPQQRLNPAAHVTLERDDRRSRATDPFRQRALAETAHPPTSRKVPGIDVMKPRPPELQAGQGARERPDAAFALFEITQRRDADPRRAGHARLGQGKVAATIPQEGE